jgi:prolyl oligopeptidase
MSKPLRLLVLFAGVILLTGGSPPPTPKVNHVEKLFGMTFNDPYAWMEAGGTTFDDWLSTQADYSHRTLDAIPGRAALLAQIRSLDSGETHVGAVVAAGRQWIYSGLRPTDSTVKIFDRPITDGTEHVLIDPSQFDTDGQTAHIDYWSASPDARHIAYGVSVGGGEIGILRIRSVDTDANLPEQMDRTRYARPSWIDNASFLYTRLSKPAPGGTQRITGGEVYLHQLGRDPSTDVLVFGPGNVTGRDIAAKYFFQGLASPDSSTIVGVYDLGQTSSPKAVFVTTKAALSSGNPVWHKVAGLEDDIRGVVLHGDMLYLRTVRGAPRQRIIRTSATAPDLAHAKTIVAEGAGTIDGMAAAADALYVRRNDGGLGRLVRVPWDGTADPVATPFDGSFVGLTTSPTAPGVVLNMQSYTRSETVFAYDPDNRRFIDTAIAPPSPVSFDDVEWTEVRVRGGDGTMVPLSIVAPRGATHDGSHPVLMYVYGAYGVTIGATFNAMRRAWFDRGGIYVVAHVRGSGGFGDEWYRAGRHKNKPNSISDFIDAAEYLIHTGWVTPAGLSTTGASAGGIVIGSAIVARPELFSGAVIDVGLLNALDLHQIPIGPSNAEEFGSPETEEGVRMLYAIDPYHRLKDGVSYPGVLISAGRNDTRVSPWMPSKFAARLQAATKGPRPALLRVNEAGGHFSLSKEQFEVDLTDTYAFLLWQAGVPGFQPSP